MRQRQQQGVVLLMALVFLLILTVAGVSAMRLANVEERMTSNFTERNIAFQAAEAALVEAEAWLSKPNFTQNSYYSGGLCTSSTCFYNASVAGSPICKDGLCFLGSFTPATSCTLIEAAKPEDEVFQSASLWDDNSDAYAVANVSPAGAANPAKYIIEFRCFAVKDPLSVPADQYDPANEYSDTYWEPYYRITAMGYGRNETTRIMLQTTYRRD